MIAFYIKLYLGTFLAFLVIDMVWLGLVARKFYQAQIGFLLSPQTNWLAAGLFYLIFIAGLIVFAVMPGVQANSLLRTLLYGALFGLVTYATYDLTNLATLKGWPVILALVDITWGIFLAASVSTISYYIARWLM
jgi:uncharacterized membrane protein